MASKIPIVAIGGPARSFVVPKKSLKSPIRKGERPVWCGSLPNDLRMYVCTYSGLLSVSHRQVVGSQVFSRLAGWLCMPDCLSLGGNPSSSTKLYSPLPNLVHGTILCSEGSRSFRGASRLWADLLRDRESADHQPSHQHQHHRHVRHQLPPEKTPPNAPPPDCDIQP